VRDARGSALDYAPVAEAVAGANAAVDDLVLDGWRGGPRHRVSTERVDAFLAAASSPTPALCNPDVMLVAPDPSEDPAGADVVVGEVHVSTEALSHSSFAPFLEERFPGFADDVLAAYRRLLAPDEELVDVTQVHRNRTWARAVLPLPDLELAGRSPAPRERVLAPADLVVFPSATGLRLRRRTGGPFLRLKANPLAWCGVERNPFSVFAFPAGAGGLAVHGRARDHLPRIRIGRAIVQRERWLVPVDELAGRDRAEQFLAAQSVRARHGLPRRIYARVAGEGKPIYCDLDSPLLVRQLARMAAGATGAAELTEMLPAPERLWLRDERGRYTSELRYASFHLGGRAEA